MPPIFGRNAGGFRLVSGIEASPFAERGGRLFNYILLEIGGRESRTAGQNALALERASAMPGRVGTFLPSNQEWP